MTIEYGKPFDVPKELIKLVQTDKKAAYDKFLALTKSKIEDI